MRLRRSSALIAALLVIAGCTAPKPSRPAPPPPPVPPAYSAPQPPPDVTADWRDLPLTPGTWRWSKDLRGSVALFGPVGADALFVIRCDAQPHRVSLSRRDGVPPGGATAMTLTTSFGTRALAAAPVTGANPAYLGSALPAGDPLLDQIAFSRGRIMIDARALPRLIVPIWAEVGRVVEDCRG